MLFLVVPIIFFSIIFVAFFAIPVDYAKIDFNDMDHFVIRENILYNCLAYEDNRKYAGVVDVNKFNSVRLSKCLGLEGDSFGVILSLNYDDKEEVEFVNERMTDRVNFCIGGSFRCSNEEVYVLVNDEGFKQGKLGIRIIGFEK